MIPKGDLGEVKFFFSTLENVGLDPGVNACRCSTNKTYYHH